MLRLPAFCCTKYVASPLILRRREAGQVAVGRLDLDDVGAEVGEHAGGVRAGQHPREVEDAHPVERPDDRPYHRRDPRVAPSRSARAGPAGPLGGSRPALGPRPGHRSRAARNLRPPPSRDDRHPGDLVDDEARGRPLRRSPPTSLVGDRRCPSMIISPPQIPYGSRRSSALARHGSAHLAHRADRTGPRQLEHVLGEEQVGERGPRVGAAGVAIDVRRRWRCACPSWGTTAGSRGDPGCRAVGRGRPASAAAAPSRSRTAVRPQLGGVRAHERERHVAVAVVAPAPPAVAHDHVPAAREGVVAPVADEHDGVPVERASVRLRSGGGTSIASTPRMSVVTRRRLDRPPAVEGDRPAGVQRRQRCAPAATTSAPRRRSNGLDDVDLGRLARRSAPAPSATSWR